MQCVMGRKSFSIWVTLILVISLSFWVQGTGVKRAQAQAADGASNTTVLVLYDTSGDSPQLGELYATAMTALASHFGSARALPVQRYRAGELAQARAAIYIGSSYDEPLPRAFIEDVQSGVRPVLWLADNIWQLSAATPDFAARYGYVPTVYSTGRIATVVYKRTRLDRDAASGPLLQFAQLNTAVARVLAWGELDSGRQIPWALRSHNLLYVAENPLAFIGPTDRYLAFCDLLFELLGPDTQERHSALVRIEDVHPNSSPATLRALADYFASAGVPFSVAVVPYYIDPLGNGNGHVPTERALHDSSEVVAALKYMVSKGGTLVLHGYTHQYRNQKNPYSAASIDDFEFFRTHIDDNNDVIWDGPVAEDSAEWAGERIRKALDEFAAVGLPAPTIFEYPHYAGSVVDSFEIAKQFKTTYQRESYFAGTLSGTAIDYRHSIAMTFPFTVHDIYGWKVIPENLGNYIPVGYNNHSTTSPADLRRAAKLHHVVRDGVVSFFFHPIYDLSILREIVEGIRAEGYVFVSPNAL